MAKALPISGEAFCRAAQEKLDSAPKAGNIYLEVKDEALLNWSHGRPPKCLKGHGILKKEEEEANGNGGGGRLV